MVNEELTNYIKDALSKGQDPAVLKTSLIQVGWQEVDIDKVINETLTPPVAPIPPVEMPRQVYPIGVNGQMVDSIKPANSMNSNFVNLTESAAPLELGPLEPIQPIATNPISDQANLTEVAGNNYLAHPDELPPELRGWNWGAFLMIWVWGIFNDVWSSLFSLIPGVGFIIMIILGIKGNEWAWKKRKFTSLEEFKAVQKAWSTWAIILFLISVVVLIAFYVIIYLKIK
jgi:hypothetical protein